VARPVVAKHIEPLNSGYRVRIIRNHVLHTVGTFPTLEAAAQARDAFLAELDRPKVSTAECTVQGVTAEELPDFTTAFSRASEEFRKKSLSALRKQSQRLSFTSPRICLAFVADQHIGSPGTDIERVFAEAEIIASMPNTRAVCVGDTLDNYIVPKLQHLNFNNRIAITDQWVMAEEYVKRLRPLAWVNGNHDGDWTMNTTGMDHLRRMIALHAPDAIYDADDCRIAVSVAGVEFPTRIRHKWRGNSIYNPTHGIERSQKWDQDFVLGVGAHTHQCGVARQFSAGGKHGLAVLCGSYKIHDTYAVELGLPKPNGSTAMAVLFDAETESMTGFDNLEAAREYMERVS
jgi:hypothetical protein